MYNDKFLFVFGSNEAGIHGAGAARHAHKNLGAEWGVGFGKTGHCFALPTKDHNIQTLAPAKIIAYIEKMFVWAEENPDHVLNLTPVGCGLAGYTKEEVKDMIVANVPIPDNVVFDRRWFWEE